MIPNFGKEEKEMTRKVIGYDLANGEDFTNEDSSDTLAKEDLTVLKPKKATVCNCFTVNMRKSPDVESKVVTTLRRNSVCYVLDKLPNGYAKVSTREENGDVGYIPYTFLDIK